MRNGSRTFALIFLLGITSASVAQADVGPAPSCPSGTYSAYLMGRRCVKNGYRLELDANHNVVEIADQPVATPTNPPATTEPVKASPQPAKTASCAMGMRTEGGFGTLLFATALALTLLSRRRLTNRASS